MCWYSSVHVHAHIDIARFIYSNTADLHAATMPLTFTWFTHLSSWWRVGTIHSKSSWWCPILWVTRIDRRWTLGVSWICLRLALGVSRVRLIGVLLRLDRLLTRNNYNLLLGWSYDVCVCGGGRVGYNMEVEI